MRFSLHEPKKLGQKYIDEPELWLETEDMVEAGDEKKLNSFY